MDFISKFFLGFVLLFSAVYRKAGANTDQLRKILRLKLVLDNRKPIAGFGQMQQSAKAKKPSKYTNVWSFFISMFTGIFMSLLVWLGADAASGLVLFFSVYLFFLAGLLISDFSAILLDERDNQIILPRPVNDSTLVVARILHILISILRIALPMALPMLISLAFRVSFLASVAVLPFVLMAVLLAVLIINGMYVLVLRHSTAKQFQNLSSWIQIIVSVLLYGSFQLGSRLVNAFQLRTVDYLDGSHPYILLNPGSWFAFGWEALYRLQVNNVLLISGLALSIVLPIAGLFVLLRLFSAGFMKSLGTLSTGNAPEASQAPAGPAAAALYKISLAERLGKLFTKKGVERQAFLTYWRITGRTKEFKLKVYPAIGYMLVYAAIIAFNARKSITEMVDSNNENGLRILLIFALYSFSFLIMSAMGYVPYSSQYKAAYVYHVSPLTEQGKMHTGLYKMLVVKFLLPFLLPISLLALALGGIGILPNIVFGLLNMLIITGMVCYIRVRSLPFSIPMGREFKQSNGCLYAMLYMIIPLLIGVAHFFMFWYLPLVCVGLVLSGIAFWLMYGSLAKASFTNVGVEEAETDDKPEKPGFWKRKKRPAAME